MDAFATYEGLGVKCSYPANWKVQQGTSSDEDNGFLIESPDAAFFAVSIFPWTDSPREVLQRAAKTLEEEYEGCEIEWIDSDLSVGDSQVIEVRFFLLDMLVVAKLRAFALAHQSFLLEQQAEDREYQKIEPVFDAMTETLIQSLDKQHGLQRLHRS